MDDERVSVLFNEPKLLKSRAFSTAPQPPAVSVLFNEPKLLKFLDLVERNRLLIRFSALQRAEIAEMASYCWSTATPARVSVLFNEPKLLKLKINQRYLNIIARRFSALQRAEIAEMLEGAAVVLAKVGFSALQRAEIAEMLYRPSQLPPPPGFSALQRAEIAEIICGGVVAVQ